MTLSSGIPDSGTDSKAVLHRTSEGFAVAAEGFKDIQILREDICNCFLLINIYEETDVGDVTPLGIERQSLLDLLSFRASEQLKRLLEPVYNVSSLIGIIQAADYLDDQAMLLRASRELALVAFRLSPETAIADTDTWPPESQALDSATGSADAVQVVEALTEDLAVLVIRVALAAHPHVRYRGVGRSRCHGSGWGGEAPATAEDLAPAACLTQARMLAVMGHLPLHKRHLVLIAHREMSGGRDRGALSLPLRDLRTAACITEAVALLPTATLTSLSLTSCSWRRASHGEDIDEKVVDEGIKATLAGVLHPLAHLTALMQLSIDFLQRDMQYYYDQTELAKVISTFHVVLGDVLSRLTQLTHLRFCVPRGVDVFWHVTWCTDVPVRHAVEGLVQGLSGLTGLRSLELENMAVSKDQRCTTKNVLFQSSFVLSDALLNMPALTHLSLAGCKMCFDAEITQSVLASLPLLSLDLNGCNMKRFSVECRGGESLGAVGVSREAESVQGGLKSLMPLSGLQCLVLTGNSCIHNEDGFVGLSHLSRLTEVQADDEDELETQENHHRFLERISSTQLQVLHLPYATCHSPTDSAHDASEICKLLERCPELRRVCMFDVFYSDPDRIVRSLAMLPHLRCLHARREGSTPPYWVWNDDIESIDSSWKSAEVKSAVASCVGLTDLTLEFPAGTTASVLLQSICSLTNLRALRWMVEIDVDTGIDGDLVYYWSGVWRVLSHTDVNAFSSLSKLSRLQFKGVCFTKEAVYKLAEILPSMVDVQDFRLEWYVVSNSVPVPEYGRDISIESVLAVMPRLPKLRTLVLSSDDELHSSEVEALVHALPEMRALRALHLGYCLSVPGATEVERALADAVAPGVEVVAINTVRKVRTGVAAS